MKVQDTDGDTFLLRAISFKDGENQFGGAGISVLQGAIVDIELCVFSNCRSTGAFGAGGAIYVLQIGSTVNIYGTGFHGNTAVSGDGADIYNGGGDNIIIHNTCPSPYSSNTPTQGKTRMRIV
jgi:hypothetical protein